MYAVSQAFLTALTQPSMIARTIVTSSDGTTYAITGGSVQMDSRRTITRTADLQIIPTGTQTTKQIYEQLMTGSVELTIKRGLQLADGSTEYVPLGVFSTDNCEYDADVTGSVTWQGSDRSKKISRARFTDPYPIASGTTLATAGTTLLQSRWSFTPVDFSNVTETIGAPITYDAGEASDPWQSARELFSDYGYDLNFDGNGNARAVKIADPATTPAVFNFGSGATQLILNATISGTFEKTYNGVIVTGEGTGVTAPVRAELYDTDTNSPTYYGGVYGKVPYFYSSPLLTTSALCNAVAVKLLAAIKGRTQGLSWPAIVNPALEPLDVISLNIGGTAVTAVIDQLTIPLAADESMTAIARRITTAQ